MNFQESLDYLYGLQFFGVKLGLENMHTLGERLPGLYDHVPCVHVAGTNGKGSVSVFLAEALRHSGLRVGLYTSPHLHCFSERIRIDGEPLGRERIVALTEALRNATEGVPVTFFEATTAIALMAFHEQKVDVAVIETGLGGRLDATNIVRPLLSLITPVSLDHCEHLGDNLSAIAREKAGIIKRGVPVVVGRQDAVAAEVILGVASSLNAPVHMAGRDFSRVGPHENLTVRSEKYAVEGLACALRGTHQLDNLAQAVVAAILLRQQGVTVTDEALRSAGRSAVWPGRLEWWRGSRALLLDVAHNRAGIGCLADYLRQEGYSSVRLVVGMSGEREPCEVLTPLEGLARQLYAVPIVQAASVAPERVAAWGVRQTVPSKIYATAREGLLAALADATPEEPVVACGSLYLVAELRQLLLEDECFVSSGGEPFL